MLIVFVMEKRFILVELCKHIEEAGIHSGDSQLVHSPISISDDLIKQLESKTKRDGFLGLGVVGLMNTSICNS